MTDNANLNPPTSIILSTKNGYHVLPFEIIIRLKSNKNYTTFHCINRESVTIARTLKDFERILPSNQFSRINKSNIINLEHIKTWYRTGNGYVEMVDDQHIPISRYKKKAFLELQYSRSIGVHRKK